ncbi:MULTISPECIES: redox-sensitive transcriptional activator SoxR [Actinokineospora]|uniref:MerR family redox-sensitive transcriptional activator SoxR n=2 Tax=Actinokineospora TaxID=39845 RepID=A0A421BD57_9PSEU|nr:MULTISPECIES: redox-sensitive transcriptional activator SoxR [Actinokineospora]RLK62240.1 MerR family redox-sensitive transcriptional activator SoxR [Actinokineospora cianjurensis]SER99137.1 MerR family transcriptional regulator, redox-sensitive transcriptional activator SoxR [Actinokineospora terrae]
MSTLPDSLTIGEVADRSGVPHTALRFYEERGLIFSERTSGNQRRYPRAVLRRLAFIRTAQRVGLSLEEIHAALDTLPERRTPTKLDWARLSKAWRTELDARIDALQRLRDNLTSCVGCGCLSLKSCHLVNTDDRLAAFGPGAPRLKAASEGGID